MTILLIKVSVYASRNINEQIQEEKHDLYENLSWHNSLEIDIYFYKQILGPMRNISCSVELEIIVWPKKLYEWMCSLVIDLSNFCDKLGLNVGLFYNSCVS